MIDCHNVGGRPDAARVAANPERDLWKIYGSRADCGAERRCRRGCCRWGRWRWWRRLHSQSAHRACDETREDSSAFWDFCGFEGGLPVDGPRRLGSLREVNACIWIPSDGRGSASPRSMSGVASSVGEDAIENVTGATDAVEKVT
jgi:hypothetical protein